VYFLRPWILNNVVYKNVYRDVCISPGIDVGVRINLLKDLQWIVGCLIISHRNLPVSRSGFHSCSVNSEHIQDFLCKGKY